MKTKKIKIFMGHLIDALFSCFTKERLIKLLKSQWLKLIVKKCVGIGFIRTRIILFIAEELYDEIGKPIMQYVFRKAGYFYNVNEGEHTLERIENAENIDDWRDSIRDA